jgi:hypothetical protein
MDGNYNSSEGGRPTASVPDKQTKLARPAPPSVEDMVSAAMNEQGFLFSQKVQESVQYPSQPKLNGPEWVFVEREYPVTAYDGSQTRIDLVFRNVAERGIYACLECKRADPLYKRWVFFNEDRSNPSGTLYFEVVQVSQRGPNVNPTGRNSNTYANHLIRNRPSDARCVVFNSYLEVAIDRGTGRAGYTETVESAFFR